MKKWYGGVISISFVMLIILGFSIIQNPIKESYITSPLYFNTTNPLEWIALTAPPKLQNSKKITPQVISAQSLSSDLFTPRNLTNSEQESLHTWNYLNHSIIKTQLLPNTIEAIKEANVAWISLMNTIEQEKNESNGIKRGKEKQCPYFLNKSNVTELNGNNFVMRVPCGLTQGSSITIIGIPNGLLGDFRIDLTGEIIPGEPDPPIIMHYSVRLHGDKLTEEPVIVQNSWTVAHDWGDEERCPVTSEENIKKVDELDQCGKTVGKEYKQSNTRHSNSSANDKSTPRKYFPFKQGFLSVATIRVGSEGIQMTVDGRHVSSFAFRQTLEPWLVSDVRISGDINVISVVASGLPTSEDSEHIIDLESLKASHLNSTKELDLFIGVVSTANNFKRRMSVRRTWMQYPPVRSGKVAVRFFVGLHKNQMVNEELWNEARTYKDIQLMPFVDYYSLIAWKTVGICIYGTQVVSSKFVMKTDDDAFVRVDEILNALNVINETRGLLYGLINSDSKPHRDPESKWFISHEEWAEENYPPWAHGPGYVVSHDIANAIYEKHKKGRLKMFKLEDVAMGIWIADLKKEGLEMKYKSDDRIFNEGCKDGYVVAHYQGPREMLCLWQKLQAGIRSECCGD